MDLLIVIFIAVIVDAIWGDDHWIWRKFKHPVALVGRFINFLDVEFNRNEFSESSRTFNGFIVIIMSIIIIWFLSSIIEGLLFGNIIGNLILGLIISILLAGKSLFVHVKDIYDDFMRDDLDNAKINLSKIVSRKVDEYDESAITRGAIESLSENLSDGYVAPLFWLLIAGLPGIFIYKFINTADSMIAYKNDKYHNFGKCTAYLDDILNFIPARLSSLLQVFASFVLKENWQQALLCIKQDASKSPSPNSGWPESAMAGALDISLGGDNFYDGELIKSDWINGSGEKIISFDFITRALWIYSTSIVIYLVFVTIFLLLRVIF